MSSTPDPINHNTTQNYGFAASSPLAVILMCL